MRTTAAPAADRENAELRFERLYARHGRAVLAYAVRRVPIADVADIVAETFLVAWRRLDDVPGEEARPWLYGVARRVLADQQRSGRRHGRADRLRQELPRVLANVPALDAPASAVAAAVAQLGCDDREVLGLSAWEQLTTLEIATVLGVGQLAVRRRLHRARRRLRATLRRAGRPAPRAEAAGATSLVGRDGAVAVAAANPLPEPAALRLALDHVEIELIEEIVGVPVSPHRRRPLRSTRRRRPVASHRLSR